MSPSAVLHVCAVTLFIALASVAALGCGNATSGRGEGAGTGSSLGGSGVSLGSGVVSGFATAGGLAAGGSSGEPVLVGGSSSGGDSDAATFVTGDPRCNGGNTTISGVVYDPAMADPLYNVTVFIPDPKTPLPTLPQGASCNACADLYPATVIASAITDDHGHFTITKSDPGPVIPTGNVPLVVQTGKWRMQFMATGVTQCQDNPQPDKTLRLPRNAGEGNLPDIAISTGNSDSLECLPLRVGVSSSEYVGGGGGPGHIHVFKGNGASTATGTPASSTALWNTTANLQKNDVVLLSCEGAEPKGMTAASQQSMYDYASAGGRVFASHFHYAWFSNIVKAGPNTGPFASANLATWTAGGNNIQDKTPLAGDIVTTLNVGGGPFPEGIALKNWLGVVNALTPTGQLDIYFTRHNADVGPLNTPSQPWIVLDPSVPKPDANATEYFSFDMPLGDAGAEQCGRVVYSDIHVSGGPGANQPMVTPDYNAGGTTAPDGCASHPLTQQEKALEFMLFDLSSCLQSVGQAPSKIPIPPPR